MLTYDEAYAATNPSLSEDQRKASAETLMAGSLANDVYWNHRSDLERLTAQAQGHGTVTAPPEEGETPTGVDTGTDPNVIDGTATEEPATGLSAGADVTPPANPAPVPSPDNSNEAIAKLRKQLEDAGISPEA